MNVVFHAVGRITDVMPYLVLGAVLHDVEDISGAEAAVRGLSTEDPAVIIFLSEEFAAAAEKAKDILVFIL